jgi:hypothetical protein
MYENPTNAPAIIGILYYPHLHVLVVEGDCAQGLQNNVKNTIKCCVWRICPSSGILKCYKISTFLVQL